MSRPGYQTTEFWLTLLVSVPAFLVSAGFIPAGDQGMVTDAVTKVMTGLIAASTLWKYVQSRGYVKANRLPFVLAGLLFLPTPSHAQMTERTCLFGCNRTSPEVMALLKHISDQNQQILMMLMNMQNQQAPPVHQFAPPAAPQLIVLGGPLQQIPLGGPPHQEIPLGGPPKQDIPLGGPPKQDIPLGGPPKQDIPLGPAPKQQIPIGVPPRQEIPLGNPPPTPGPKPGPTAYQRYSRNCLWRPASR